MQKTSDALKLAFQIFNIIFGITGGIILFIAVFGHGIYHEAEEGDSMLPGIVFFYIIGIVVIALAVLGIYGSRKEKKWALILCCIGTLLLSLTILLIAGAASQVQILEAVAHFKDEKPLDKATENIQKVVDQIQTELECCGLDEGYQDWGEHVPESCHCPEHYHNTSKCIEVHHQTANVSEEVVYSEPCLPIMIQYIDKLVKITLGMMFGFSTFAMIGAVLSVALLCQMRRRLKPTPVTFSVNYKVPEYRELPDATENI